MLIFKASDNIIRQYENFSNRAVQRFPTHNSNQAPIVPILTPNEIKKAHKAHK